MKYFLIYQWIIEETGMVFDYGARVFETLEEAKKMKAKEEEYWKDMLEIGRLKLFVTEVVK